MDQTVRRERKDGIDEMVLYGQISSGIGVVGLAGFVGLTMFAGQPNIGLVVLAIAVGVQWLFFVTRYQSTYRRFRDQAADGLSGVQVSRSIVAAATAETGWVFLFIGLVMAAFVTGGAELIGVSPILMCIGAGILAMLPGVVILLTVVLAANGARDA